MNIHICGPSLEHMYIDGKRYYFEYHSYLGPTFINQKTREVVSRPHSKKFWGKFNKWAKRRKAKK